MALCNTFLMRVMLSMCCLVVAVSQAVSGVTRCKTPVQTPEKRVLRSSMAVKALVANTYPDSRYPNGYLAELWLLDVYKGADKLAASLGLTLAQDDDTAKLRDRRVNVSQWGDDSKCWNSLAKQKTYIVLLTTAGSESGYKQFGSGRIRNSALQARYDEHYGAAIDYSVGTEKKILKALGWNAWTEWGACSATCGGGIQSRQRSCGQPGSPGTCPTYNVEERTCNTFDCKGSVNTLSVTEDRYYKPSPSAFQRVPDRSTAWQIRPGSYFLLPYQQAFGQEFPNEFTIFLTIKPAPESEGIIFSLNGRKSRQEYISLGLNGGRLELVHSLPNGSKIIDIPAKITDGNWHQLALSVQGGSSVRTYLDCHWITTQILHSHSLAIPADTDLIVGYMFQGELEQLTVNNELFSVSQQCSPNSVPYRDEKLMSKEASPLFPQQQLKQQKQQQQEQQLQQQQEQQLQQQKQQQKQQQQQNILVRTTSSTSAATGSDIAIVEIIDGKNHNGKELSWKSAHTKETRDYLEEEYVDLDWKESKPVSTNQVLSDEPFKAKTKKRTSWLSQKKDSKISQKDLQVLEGSGDQPDEEDTKKEIGSGNEEFELEWSSWTSCTVTCGEGQQHRTSRCQDNGYLEECIAAGVERRQVRSCKIQKCFSASSTTATLKQKNKQTKKPKTKQEMSPLEMVEYEMITQNEVESIKNRLLREDEHQDQSNNNTVSRFGINQYQQNQLIPTHTPKEGVEEQTNAIPHIPNYWIPVKSKSLVSDEVESFQKSENNNLKVQITNEEKKTISTRPSFGGNKVNSCFCKNGGSCLEGSNKCRCRKGYTGKKCERPLCRPDCLNKGECVAPDVCSCPEGFTGARCQQAFCYPSCLNGGLCLAPFQCSCPLGVSGTFCQEFSCTPKCGNGGLCIGHNVCSCPHGFSGPDCRDRTCTAHCENGGLCTMPDNLCKCRQGFYGARCQKKICRRYIAVREPQQKSFKQVVDVEYDSVCGDEQTEMITCKKTRPEYRSIVKVVYRTAYKCADDLESEKSSKKFAEKSWKKIEATNSENSISDITQ